MQLGSDVLSTSLKRPAIWPLIIAPIVGGFYYLFLKDAFSVSITDALGLKATQDINLENLAGPHWGSHWFYRSLAEFLCIGFGSLIAAGIARGREVYAGVLSTIFISIFFVIKIGMLIYAWKYFESDSYSLPEPWYQYVIDMLIIFSAPAIGFITAELAKEINEEEPQGFAGINRWHFLWLWLACHAYAVGLIGPVIQLYWRQVDFFNIISFIIGLIIYGIPIAALLIPAHYGLAFLTNDKGRSLHPAMRNFIGSVILILGFFPGYLIGLSIQYGWTKLYSAIF